MGREPARTELQSPRPVCPGTPCVPTSPSTSLNSSSHLPAVLTPKVCWEPACYISMYFFIFQNLYDLDDDDDVIAPIPTKQMKFAASGSFLHHMVCYLTFFSHSLYIWSGTWETWWRVGSFNSEIFPHLGPKIIRTGTNPTPGFYKYWSLACLQTCSRPDRQWSAGSSSQLLCLETSGEMWVIPQDRITFYFL